MLRSNQELYNRVALLENAADMATGLVALVEQQIAPGVPMDEFLQELQLRLESAVESLADATSRSSKALKAINNRLGLGGCTCPNGRCQGECRCKPTIPEPSRARYQAPAAPVAAVIAPPPPIPGDTCSLKGG